MEFVVKGGSLDKQRTGCIVVGVYEGGKLSPSAMELDAASGHALTQALSRGDLEGELGTTLLLTRIPKVASERVLLVGLGPEREFVESSYHTALCAATRTLRTTGAARRDALPQRASREWPRRRMEDRAGGACRHGRHVSLRQAQERAAETEARTRESSRSTSRIARRRPPPRPPSIGQSRSPRASRSPRISATCPATCAPRRIWPSKRASSAAPRLRGEDPRASRHREARHERIPRGRARQPPAAEAHRHGVPRRRAATRAGRPRRQGNHV